MHEGHVHSSRISNRRSTDRKAGMRSREDRWGRHCRQALGRCVEGVVFQSVRKGGRKREKGKEKYSISVGPSELHSAAEHSKS